MMLPLTTDERTDKQARIFHKTIREGEGRVATKPHRRHLSFFVPLVVDAGRLVLYLEKSFPFKWGGE